MADPNWISKNIIKNMVKTRIVSYEEEQNEILNDYQEQFERLKTDNPFHIDIEMHPGSAIPIAAKELYIQINERRDFLITFIESAAEVSKEIQLIKVGFDELLKAVLKYKIDYFNTWLSGADAFITSHKKVKKDLFILNGDKLICTLDVSTIAV